MRSFLIDMYPAMTNLSTQHQIRCVSSKSTGILFLDADAFGQSYFV